MPIQFRCAACQQLLGIAKRKAGSVVDCPTCQTKTLVPSLSTDEVPPDPPVRRERIKPVSIFDRVDVDKLLQKPTRPELVGGQGLAQVAVAPPPVRRKMVFTPEHQETEQKEMAIEPQVMPRFGGEDVEPVDDEPFALSPATASPSLSSTHRLGWLSLFMVLGALFVLGAFLAGHWVGAHRPLF